MKIIFSLYCLTGMLLQGCNAQSTAGERVLYNPDFKWSITIPAGFDTVSADAWARLQNRGSAVIEQTYDTLVTNNATTIFVYKSDAFNYFESNHQPFDPATDGDYVESFRNVNAILYGTFEAQMPDARLDSAASTQTIDGLVFQTFRVSITLPNKVVLQVLIFSRLFGNREFTVNIMTIDRSKEKALLHSWLTSKFEQ